MDNYKVTDLVDKLEVRTQIGGQQMVVETCKVGSWALEGKSSSDLVLLLAVDLLFDCGCDITRIALKCEAVSGDLGSH